MCYTSWHETGSGTCIEAASLLALYCTVHGAWRLKGLFPSRHHNPWRCFAAKAGNAAVCKNCNCACRLTSRAYCAVVAGNASHQCNTELILYCVCRPTSRPWGTGAVHSHSAANHSVQPDDGPLWADLALMHADSQADFAAQTIDCGLNLDLCMQTHKQRLQHR